MRTKLWTLAGIALTGAVSLLAGAQTWVSFMLDSNHSVEVSTGHEINSALSPVSIAIVAAALALTIAGPVFRRVLGVLVALLGAGLVALTWAVLASPIGSVAGKITELTGLTGGGGGDGVIVTWSQVTWSQVSPWAYTSLIAGLVAVLLGAAVVILGGKWGTAGRKYDAERKLRANTESKPDRISDWDLLSDGDDPSGEEERGENIR
ncbi:Trp biosynthesis-associated membrane protein [Leucobacter insecticola]|uniref:Trp biosynthesis-associated membrane protein n=1 Tax=Leucobacter insecticola TaxID=2714934 RepID=A0A6G8FIX2_9MICO|nr:Trp biosynthesis-associated membrane protein [Leucobacter insecticola]QIM16416.1 Trp biosynthesis-associated membrane protein [Leucobacter insecticola]